ncbi:MAG: ZIP family metal transporter [Candidatus Theseobacter exili]|nr:ZIP family metal transporter [Candidatus Theseobacter exili]
MHLTGFEWFALVCILLVTFAGGYLPLFKRDKIRHGGDFPSGEAFAVGIFIALSLTIMLPAGLHLLGKVFPGLGYPIASVIAISAFFFLLALEHITEHIKSEKGVADDKLSPATIPIIMTIMIAIPSFFLGVALGVSGTSAAIFIFVAIIAHKSSAGFALALKMVRSTLTIKQTIILFCMFAVSTPIGIFVGQDIHTYLTGTSVIFIKGCILSLASGTFLYMSTLHELKRSPMVIFCCRKKGFYLMIAGFVITALVRWLLGEAHHM